VTERKTHHFFDYGHRILGSLLKTQSDNGVKAGSVAFIAYIVAIYAACFAELPLMTYGALHELVLIEIHEGRFANKAFIFHDHTSKH
jgi:hypothetical protein